MPPTFLSWRLPEGLAFWQAPYAPELPAQLRGFFCLACLAALPSGKRRSNSVAASGVAP